MTYQQLIDKWEEDREKALYYASSISAFLIDLKDMDKKEVNNERD